jgi:hypothetical protein|tara:strand:- start:528 stop:680 length:153 start_codon:yes stop_codon:yes gene_type:complete
MKLKTDDRILINQRKCQQKGCKDKAEGILNKKYLCKRHYNLKKWSGEQKT